eukprot:1159482-Pelagomonas_calceolata.AAC.4
MIDERHVPLRQCSCAEWMMDGCERLCLLVCFPPPLNGSYVLATIELSNAGAHKSTHTMSLGESRGACIEQ